MERRENGVVADYQTPGEGPDDALLRALAAL
jgi:hypothetical protein